MHSNSIVTFDVEGMSCNHCVNSIKNAVGALKGVENVAVDLTQKKVTIKYTAELLSTQKLKETIEDQGFEIK